MVYANNKYPYPNAYVSAISVQYVYHEMNILLTCILILFFYSFLPDSRPIISCYVTCHVTAVACLFII